MGTAPSKTKRNSWYHPVSVGRAFAARPKILVAIAAGIVTYVLLRGVVPPSAQATLAWDVGGLVYLSRALWIMGNCGIDDIRARAVAHDESAIVIPIVVIAAIAASFLAVAGVLSEAKGAGDGAKPAYLLLAGGTILMSWSVMQIIFTIHYAHEFYAPPAGSEKPESSLGFAGEEKPDFWDFFYFAVSVGATSQTSDTGVKTHKMRRLVTLHAIISFFFNTIVLALTINIAAGLI